MLNPFDLLGATIDTPISKLRSNYYALALLAHPDVGGSTEDMITLKACYDWIMRQLNLVKEYPDKDYDTTKTGFDEFLQNQIKEGIPPLNLRELCAESYGLTREQFDTMIVDISMDVFQKDVAFQYVSHELQLSIWKNQDILDLTSFVVQKVKESLDKRTLDSASVPHGYGSLMDTREDEKAISFGSTSMIVYQEPDSMMNTKNGRDLAIPSQLDDYSNETQCDYKKAFQWPLPEKEWIDTSTLEERLIAKQFERQM